MSTAPAGRLAAVLTMALLSLFPADLLAQTETPPQIERVRVGLPAGKGVQESGRSRNGSWAPVAITLKAGAKGNARDRFRLRIESTDLEDLGYQYTVPVPALDAGSERTVTGYIVPGGDGATFRITLETQDGRPIQALPRFSRDASRDEVIGDLDILFLGAGAGLSQLKRAAEKLDRPEGKEVEIDPSRGRRQFVFAEDASLLPDRWFGYDAVDVVVLATGKRDFVVQLTQDSESARRNALLEWVRRGGRLVMSVGRNKQEVAQLLARMPLLDVKITGSTVVPALPLLSVQWCGREGHLAPLRQVEVATVEPGRGVHTLVREHGQALLMQASCGLGRVILVAFDLDMSPFTTWDGQAAFWTRLQNEIAPYLPVQRGNRPRGMVQPGKPGGPPGPMGDEIDPGQRFDYRGELKRSLEIFEDVPVISFGRVALFILFYIALVGPLDYFILKKLVKRLELTWITFPLTVLIVSVAAYLTAYAMKGDELRINKIDLVDIDLHPEAKQRQVYGHTWFTLFSPRVQSFTVGIAPADDSWTAPIPEGAPGPVVTLLEGGDRTPRAGASSLFPRPYEYAPEATGLFRVPVPVWATRSFTASWKAPLRSDRPALGIDDAVGPIRVSRGGQGLVGKLTNNLPVELQWVTLFYRGKWYSLGTLAPGESRRLEPLFAREAQGQNRDLKEWFAADVLRQQGPPLAPTGRPVNARFQEGRSAYQRIKELMFYRAAPETVSTNAGLRPLDQSWRLQSLPEVPAPRSPRFRDEIVLVCRAPLLSDRAEEVTTHGASPTRLWLGRLPDGKERPRLSGFITQETYLRVFIPVQSDR